MSVQPSPRSSSLSQRVISSLVLIPILVLPVYWSVWLSVGLVLIFMWLGLRELFDALAQAGYHPRPLMGFSVGALFCVAAAIPVPLPIDAGLAALWISLLLSLISELPRKDREGSLYGWGLTFAGACYFGGLVSSYISIRRIDAPPLDAGWLAFLHIPPGAAWIFTVFAITWLQDTAAFFVGRAYGRHQMAPYLSPKKSWEGATGGFVVAVLTSLVAVPILGLPISYPAAAVIGAAGGIFGPLGDLVESLIKRQIGIKDIGSTIPGHGGVLDRADSMVFVGPTLYLLIRLFI